MQNKQESKRKKKKKIGMRLPNGMNMEAMLHTLFFVKNRTCKKNMKNN